MVGIVEANTLAGRARACGHHGLSAISGFQGPLRGPGSENRRVDLGRIAWLITALACLVAVLILLLEGYYGYAGVTLAVAMSAAINLT